VLVPTLLVVAATSCVVALALRVGPGEVTLGEIVDVLARRTSGAAQPRAATVDTLVWQLRLPRALLTLLVGGALGMAGALTQGLFRNPLAEPGVLGVSTGAAAFAVVGFVLGIDLVALWAVPLLAAVGAFVVLLVLLVVSSAGTRGTTLLLSGVALSAFGGAVITVMIAMNAERWELGIKIVHWLMGTFESRSWPHVFGAAPALLLGGLLALYVRRDLDVLHLGDDTASSLGVDLRRTRWLTLGAVAVLVGTATALCGVLGFVGLVVPHMVRLVAGPGHTRLVPLSALFGGLLMAVVDLGIRTMPGAPMPPGVVTSFLGAPFFVWLLARRDRELSP